MRRLHSLCLTFPSPTQSASPQEEVVWLTCFHPEGPLLSPVLFVPCFQLLLSSAFFVGGFKEKNGQLFVFFVVRLKRKKVSIKGPLSEGLPPVIFEVLSA